MIGDLVTFGDREKESRSYEVSENDVRYAYRLFLNRERESAQLVDLFARRTHSDIANGTCFELGCGVGRVTRFLAERFRKVVAADISPGNLEVCKQYLRNEGVNNVELLQIKDPIQLTSL